MIKSKFKTGDKVRVLDGSKLSEYEELYGWTYPMNLLVGRICTIDEIVTNYKSYGYTLKEDTNACQYIYDERGLELVKEA